MEGAEPVGAAGSWWQRQASREAGRDRLGAGERAGNIVGIAVIAAIFLLFLHIQYNDVFGFFTSAFGPAEQLAFYGSLLFGIVPNLTRALTGSRNAGRLTDVASSIVFVVAGTYLLITFPFDFSHLIALAPDDVEARLSWVTNSLFMLLLRIVLVLSVLGAAFNAWMYLSVRDELLRRRQILYR